MKRINLVNQKKKKKTKKKNLTHFPVSYLWIWWKKHHLFWKHNSWHSQDINNLVVPNVKVSSLMNNVLEISSPRTQKSH